jgi:hypothetical protein
LILCHHHVTTAPSVAAISGKHVLLATAQGGML